MLAVSQKGEWKSWAEQALDAVRRAARLSALRDEYHARLQRVRASALLLKLVDGLFHHPAITVPGAARQLNVTQRAASQNVGKLVQAGILAEATGRARYRIFVANAIIRAIEEDLPPTPPS